MTFKRRKIDVTLQLGKGDFGGSGFNTVTLAGLRVSASIQKQGDPGFSTASIRVWGLTESVMNQLTTLGKPLQFFRDNVVTLMAGDDEAGMSLVFTGTIDSAYQDFSDAPNVSLNITAFIGLLQANKPAVAYSVKGSASATTILAGLAAQMGLNFENSGVSVTLSNPYFAGSPRAQVLACCAAANCAWTIDNNTLAVWPKGSARRLLVPLISPDNGLVGYPQYTSAGVMLTTLYNPGVNVGAPIELRTSITPANGQYNVTSVTYDLESETPGGKWFSLIEAYRPENVQ